MVSRVYARLSLLVVTLALVVYYFRPSSVDEPPPPPDPTPLESATPETVTQEDPFSDHRPTTLNIPPDWMMRRPTTRAELATKPERGDSAVGPAREETASPIVQAEPAIPVDISRFILPYTIPWAMMSSDKRPSTTLDEKPAPASQPPAWVVVQHDDTVPKTFAIDSQAMLSKAPAHFHRDWISRQDVQPSVARPPGAKPTGQVATPPVPREENRDAISRAMYLIRQGDARLASGRLQEAEDFYKEALSLYPTMFYINQQLGRLMLLRENYDEAVDYLLIAVQDDQIMASAWNDLGIAYLYSGNIAASLSAFESAIAMDNQFFEPVFNTGLAFKRMGRIDEAVPRFLRFLEVNPTDARVYRELAAIDWLNNDHASALARLERAIELDPTWAIPVLDAAVIHASQGNRIKAIEYLTTAIDLSPIRQLVQIYNQPVFREIRLHPESKPFEALLAAKARKEIR